MSLDLGMISKELGQRKKKPIPFPLRNIQEVEFVGSRYHKECPTMSEEREFQFLFGYLTGQRISETLQTSTFDVSVQEKEGKEFMVVSSITLKNRVQPRRSLPVPMFGDEKAMAEKCWEKVQSLPAGERLMGKLKRTNAWNRLSPVSVDVLAIDPTSRSVSPHTMKVHPHYLRHCRASHLAMFKGYDLFKLMQYFGWTTASVASIYAALNWQTLAEPFIGKEEVR